jgi:D-lyxose ketol-isomerase
VSVILAALAPVLDASTYVSKAWGAEYWLENNELYCAKILEIFGGWQCSLHYHPVKDETFTVLEGVVQLETYTAGLYPDGFRFERLEPGARVRLNPLTVHRFGSVYGAFILEMSTKHDDGDVNRIVESQRIP